VTVAEWLDHWLGLGCPGKRKEKPGRRSVIRYSQLLNTHVVPALGACRLQKLTADQISAFYATLGEKIAPRTAHSVHTMFAAALKAAVRSGALSVTPMVRVLAIPSPGEGDHGRALDEEELNRLVDGFRNTALHLFIAIAAGTGMRRNEVLGLQWVDFSEADKTLKVERSVEQTKGGGATFKQPKTRRGIRSVVIDEHLVDLLRAEREPHRRLIAGLPGGSVADLRMIKLPAGALILPSTASPFDLVRPRNPAAVTKLFLRRARQLGFKDLRLHDLRGSHITQLLRRGMPLDLVAKRCGHDVRTMLASYAKDLPSDDARMSKTLAAMASGTPSE
jgi:integrase